MFKSRQLFATSPRLRRTLAVLATGAVLSAAAVGCGTPQNSGGGNTTGAGNTAGGGQSAGGTIVVGGKNFTEQDIMANMIQQLIQKYDPNMNVKMKTWLDSNVVWTAFKNGSIDVYVEYTGTGLVNILKDKVITDPQKAYDTVKQEMAQKYNVDWMQPIGFNNTYAMAMTQKEANQRGLTTISQMAKQSGDLVLGTEQDFIERSDGLPAMKKLYGTHFKSVKSMEIGLKYKALAGGNVDLIDAFSTDGNIPANNLVLLKDDKQLFPPYYAVPVIRDSTLQAHPELKDILNKLAGKIDDSEMQKLNGEVDLNHKKASDVAKQWLTQQGLI